MATFGKYEVVTELHAGDRGSVFSARAAGGGREIKYAVKTFSPRSLDQDEQFWESQSFTERARVQQRAAEAGSYWAPVHETGTSPAGTYYVTDFHPLSAASLVKGRVEISAGVLHSIVRSVVAGLSELKSAAGRAHGNLKASNILINSRGDVAVAGAVLTDPAAAPEAAKAGEAGDLYALGELIHLLVLGAPFRGGGAWPLEPDREWLRLGGRQGRQWRRLCNDLLSPDPGARPQGLDVVAKRVRRLVPRRARPSRRLSLAVAAAVVLVAAGAAAVLGVRDAGARKEVCAAKERWAGGLTVALADPKRRALLESDPDLLRVARELDQADLQTFDCDGPTNRFGFNPNLRKFRQTQDTLDAVRRAERGLSPIQWGQLARAADLQGRFEARGWMGPARHLADCIARARPGSPDLAGGIERFLTALSAVDANLPAVNEQWLALQTRTRSLDETRDPHMKAFAAYLRTAAASSVELTDAGFGSLAVVADATHRAERLLDAQKLLGPQYDEGRFKEEVVDRIPLKEVQATDIDRYLAGMAAYKVREDDIEKAVEEMKAAAAENERLVRESGIDEKQATEFDSKIRSVDGFIKTFADGKFIDRDFVAGDFAKARDRVAADVASIKNFVRMEDVNEWLRQLQPLAGVESDVLKKSWEDWKDNLLKTATQFAGQHARIVELQVETRRLQDVLQELNRAVPQVPKQLTDEVLAKAAEGKREEVLASLLKERPPINFARQPEHVRMVRESAPVNAARAAFEQWTRDLAELGKDFPIRRRILTPDVRPDEKWAAAKPEFWNDRIVQTFVGADVDRLQRLRSLSGRPRDELLKVAQNETREELALHAWRLLGADSATPAWPTRAGELAVEAALRRRLAEMLAKGVPTDEARRAAGELNEEAPRRWRRFAEAAGINESLLASAVDLRDAFGVDAAQFAPLAPETRFNLSLLAARRHPADAPEGRLSEVVRELKTAAGELKDNAAAADLGRRLARIDAPEPFPDARGEEYPLQPRDTNVRIMFKRVKPPGRRPFFLATTELSTAQFAAVVDAASGWDDVRSLVWWPQPGEIGDPRRGPRSWEWVMRPAPRMDPPEAWLFPEDANDFPAELRDPSAGRFNRTVISDAAGGRPREHHPVQQVSAEAAMYVAALAGCRLPTPAEWRAAYDGFEKAVPPEQWNLRDRTWQVQRDHASAAGGGTGTGAADGANPNGPAAPDEGIFLPAQPKAATGAAAKAYPHRDGTLYFRPADAAGGSVFRHLVGNVAELVCEASEPFEQLKDRGPRGIKAFAAEASAGLYVVGGSALSPLEVPVDVPAPVKPGVGFADVGFRLAFTAPSKNLAEELEWVLAGQGFVQPGTAENSTGTEKPRPAS